MLGAVCTPKQHFSIEIFCKDTLMLLFGLESGWIEIWWYPEWMSKIEKYFVPLSYDPIWSILDVSIGTRLPMNFAWVVWTFVNCLLIPYSQLLIT